jgi:hypothetical protein
MNSLAELDQLAGTLALRDPTFVQYLLRTYDVDGRTHAPLRQLPKQWQWKNAYHSFEHALVGDIVARQLQGELVTLYYAFPGDPSAASVQP